MIGNIGCIGQGLGQLAGPKTCRYSSIVKVVMKGNVGINVPCGEFGEDRMALCACSEE